jgi:hypothetical protein
MSVTGLQAFPFHPKYLQEIAERLTSGVVVLLLRRTISNKADNKTGL